MRDISLDLIAMSFRNGFARRGTVVLGSSVFNRYVILSDLVVFLSLGIVGVSISPQ